MKKIIVTGGLGFIGSNLIDLLISKNYYVINIDKVTYSSNFYNTLEHKNSKKYKFFKCDIKDKKLKCYHESSFTELSAEPYRATNTYSLKSTRAKSSRQITRNGIVTNLRLRIVLNNGVKALLGLSKSNKYSIPVIKVQQDKVNAVLESTTLYSQCDFQ